MKKNIILFFVSILICSIANAQKSDSTRIVTKEISFNITGNFTELKQKKGIYNGEAEIIFSSRNGNSIIAKGLYKDNVRFGRWQFFEHTNLVQVYNYGTKKVEQTYNNLENKLTYEIDSLNTGDKVIYPKKIGSSFAFHYLIDGTSTSGVFEKAPRNRKVFSIFTISETGKLVRFQGHVIGENFDKIADVNIASYNDDFFQFSPTYVNGVAVPCKIIYAW